MFLCWNLLWFLNTWSLTFKLTATYRKLGPVAPSKASSWMSLRYLLSLKILQKTKKTQTQVTSSSNCSFACNVKEYLRWHANGQQCPKPCFINFLFSRLDTEEDEHYFWTAGCLRISRPNQHSAVWGRARKQRGIQSLFSLT